MQSKKDDCNELLPLFEDPNEPLFVLRGSDPTAYLTLLMWSCLKDKRGDSQSAQQGIQISSAMEDYARRRGGDADQAFGQWTQLLTEANARLQTLLGAVAAERVQLGQRLQ